MKTNQAAAFAFSTATSPEQLMDELEKFIVFWHGAWRNDLGEPQDALARADLPSPLRRLYRFAGRWKVFYEPIGEEVPIFSIVEHLRLLDQLKQTDDGKLIFLDENQGNWTWATLTTGDDPPVWVEDTLNTFHRGKWVLVTNSLSRFLVTFCLEELFYGSTLQLKDENLALLFKSSTARVTPLWLDGPFFYPDAKYSFYLFNGSILVRKVGDDYSFATNDQSAIAFLQGHQGEINQVILGTESGWTLKIAPDGSAEITLSNWNDSSARATAGTFDFGAVRDELLARRSQGENESNSWFVTFLRLGQQSFGSERVDQTTAKHLFHQAIQAVTVREEKFDELLRQFPPPI